MTNKTLYDQDPKLALRIAETCHELNRTLCIALGDTSQPRWADAEEWQVASALAGVEAIYSGEIKAPGDSHRSWMQHKAADGWTYGKTKDPAKKTHPCMVEFKKLPPSQQLKDHLFYQTVVHLLTEAGYRRTSEEYVRYFEYRAEYCPRDHSLQVFGVKPGLGNRGNASVHLQSYPITDRIDDFDTSAHAIVNNPHAVVALANALKATVFERNRLQTKLGALADSLADYRSE